MAQTGETVDRAGLRTEVSDSGERTVILTGRLDSAGAGRIWKDGVREAERAGASGVIVDASGITYCDGGGTGLLVEMRRIVRARQGAFSIRGLDEEFQVLLAQFPAENFDRTTSDRPRKSVVSDVGRRTVQFFDDLRMQVAFIGEVLVRFGQALLRPRTIRWRDTLQVVEAAGVDAVPINILMGFLIGLILAFQAAIGLKAFGAELYAADAVAIGLVRELGPIMTAIILAGRSGSAFAAELGTMKVNEEIDALASMGFSPVSFLVVPRMLAGVFVTPLLLLLHVLSGLVGGALVVMSLGYPLVAYTNRVLASVDTMDLGLMIFKGLLFGMMVAGVGCLRGLQTGKGAQAVGVSATRSVVAGIVLIIVVDGILAVICTILGIEAMAEDTIIRVESFTAAYGDFVVIDNIDFEVKAGEVFVILGGSGCGKSTMLRHMIGLHRPATGRILINDKDISTSRGNERVEILKGIGVMFQQGALFGSMSLRENVRLPLEEYTSLPRPAMDLIADMKLSLVGLTGFESHTQSEISGGMRKRAAIARAMALDPKILFLDEPSAGLDPITSAELDQLILRLAKNLGITFVIVTHELPSIYTIADRVIMLDRRVKKIVDSGPPAELRDHSKDPWVRSFFNREVGED